MIAAAFAAELAALGAGTYNGAGPAGGPPIHVEQTPATGDYLAVYAEPISSSDVTFDEWRAVLIRVIVRVEDQATPNRTPIDLAQTILDHLDGAESVTIAAGTPDELTVNYSWARDTHPIPLGPDDRGVPKWSTVLMATVEHQTAHRERQTA